MTLDHKILKLEFRNPKKQVTSPSVNADSISVEVKFLAKTFVFPPIFQRSEVTLFIALRNCFY